MTLDPETHAERTAILSLAPEVTNPGQQAALQMACALWTHDERATLTPVQRDWLRAKVLAGTMLTPQEIARLTPGLLAWAEAHYNAFASILREVLGLETRPAVERPRDVVFQAGVVRENTP